jgi:VanZ family protein
LTAPPAAEAAAARRARLVLLIFASFVVYGSFFPFAFRVDPTEVERDLVRFWDGLTLFDARGRKLFSIADLVSNVLLGVPVGLFLVQGSLVGRALVSRLLGALVVETLFAGAVEVGQILAPTRTASALDVLAQVSGALFGALLAHGLGITASRTAEARLAALVRARPALIIVGVLAALLAADALYPFALTLDVSTAWGNLKRGQWRPLGSAGRRLWSDLLAERVVPYAGLAVAARLTFRTGAPLGRAAPALVWVLATLWAVGLEAGKLLIVGRAPNVDNVLLAAIAAAVGLVAFGPLAASPEARRRAPARLAGLTGALLAYRQLTPFDWLDSVERIAARAARTEWIPLASYFYADPHSALFDLGNKLAWSALFGASLRAAGAARPGWYGLAFGLTLEALQILQASHVPALTDALAIGAGAALGGRALDAVRRWRGAAASVSIATH